MDMLEGSWLQRMPAISGSGRQEMLIGVKESPAGNIDGVAIYRYSIQKELT